jgi:hypothetical protein
MKAVVEAPPGRSREEPLVRYLLLLIYLNEQVLDEAECGRRWRSPRRGPMARTGTVEIRPVVEIKALASG